MPNQYANENNVLSHYETTGPEIYNQTDGDIDLFIGILGNGNSDFLQTAYQLSQLIRNSKNIEVAIERASRLVAALKNYSHMHNNEEKIEADISEGILTVLTLYKNQLKHGIQLSTEFEPLPKVYCYPDELNQVWTNLISNALDAMNGKGKLDISLYRSGDYVGVKVSDSGSGIPESIQPRIFDAFYSTKSPGVGSGLGLFIVKEIVDKHSGKISFETSDKGTVFTVLLPLLIRKNIT
jgi:signal transduction histidine kinase